MTRERPNVVLHQALAPGQVEPSTQQVAVDLTVDAAGRVGLNSSGPKAVVLAGLSASPG
jgi:hypothetical protein